MKIIEERNKLGSVKKTRLKTPPTPRSKPSRGRILSPSLFSTSTTSNRVNAMKPKMGGLVQGCCGEETWTRGTPKSDWSCFKDPNAVSFPQPKQMHSSSAKAATGHLKCTEGTSLDEACKFKISDDPDNQCSRLETHFKKHDSDTTACGRRPNNMKNMVSSFTACPLFTVDNMKTQNNKDVVPHCDMCDKQNDDNALECCMNSLGEER